MLFTGRLIDGKGKVFEKATVELMNDKITRVDTGNVENVEPGCLNLGNKTIMPGLIEAHIHLWGVRTMDFYNRLVVPQETNLLRATHDLNRLIDAGYTSVRDAGGRGGIFLREAVNEGEIRGPRIRTPGMVISQTGGHLDLHFVSLEEAKIKATCRITDGPDDCRRAVREQFRSGADYIKICVTGGLTGEKEGPEETQFSEEEIKVIVAEANKKNRKVSAHCYGLSGTRLAVQLGVQLIEHGVFLDEELCELMIKRNAVLTPTLALSQNFANEAEKYGTKAWAIEKAKRTLDVHITSFQLAHRLGVRMAAGSDFVGAPMCPHGKNALELEVMVKAGYSPMEAIVSATKVASEVLEIDSMVGSIERGKIADMIIVDGNPLDDIRILQDQQKIEVVIKGGKVVKSLLPEVKL